MVGPCCAEGEQPEHGGDVVGGSWYGTGGSAHAGRDDAVSRLAEVAALVSGDREGDAAATIVRSDGVNRAPHLA